MWLAFAVLSKVGIKNVNSNLGTAIRTVIVFIFSWIMVFVLGAQNGVFTIGTKTLVFLILSGFATGVSWLCYFRALKIGDVNKVASIDKSSTILTMLLAFIFLREEITYLKAICIVLIGLGTFLMIEKHGSVGSICGADVHSRQNRNFRHQLNPRHGNPHIRCAYNGVGCGYCDKKRKRHSKHN